jgi:hypothetical protein
MYSRRICHHPQQPTLARIHKNKHTYAGSVRYDVETNTKTIKTTCKQQNKQPPITKQKTTNNDRQRHHLVPLYALNFKLKHDAEGAVHTDRFF